MWQAAMEATSISSGSAAASRLHGALTADGEAEPGSETPPSKRMVWPRE